MDDCDSDLNSKFNEADELAQFVRTSILPSTDELLRTKSFRGIELLEYCTKLKNIQHMKVTEITSIYGVRRFVT